MTTAATTPAIIPAGILNRYETTAKTITPNTRAKTAAVQSVPCSAPIDTPNSVSAVPSEFTAVALIW